MNEQKEGREKSSERYSVIKRKWSVGNWRVRGGRPMCSGMIRTSG